jgi:beta-glucoside operon transcriptional antiterminator
MKQVVKRIYNNNVILSENASGEEIILVGKGLAFGLNKGDLINLDKVEKKFELKKDVNYKFQELIKDISMEEILICDDVIDYIKKASDKEINDSIYVTLTDHIINMINRLRQGIDFDSAALLNIKSLYKNEYKTALGAIDILRKKLDMHIDESEASFITLHIVNAKLNSNMMQMYEVTTIMEGILAIVEKDFDIDKEDNQFYDRFIMHCRFFVQRIVNQEYLEKDTSTYEPMFQVMKGLYVKQLNCVNKVAEYIEHKYDYMVEDDEKMYLLLHLVKLTS